MRLLRPYKSTALFVCFATACLYVVFTVVAGSWRDALRAVPPGAVLFLVVLVLRRWLDEKEYR